MRFTSPQFTGALHLKKPRCYFLVRAQRALQSTSCKACTQRIRPAPFGLAFRSQADLHVFRQTAVKLSRPDCLGSVAANRRFIKIVCYLINSYVGS